MAASQGASLLLYKQRDSDQMNRNRSGWATRMGLTVACQALVHITKCLSVGFLQDRWSKTLVIFLKM